MHTQEKKITLGHFQFKASVKLYLTINMFKYFLVTFHLQAKKN